MFYIESQNYARNTTIQNMSKIAKKRKNRKILRFITTLSTSNSASMGHIQVCFRIRIDLLAVNGSSKWQSVWIHGADTNAVQS